MYFLIYFVNERTDINNIILNICLRYNIFFFGVFREYFWLIYDILFYIVFRILLRITKNHEKNNNDRDCQREIINFHYIMYFNIKVPKQQHF